MKFFLTGASGILGTDIKEELEKANQEVLGFNSTSLDIRNFDMVLSKVSDFKPDIIIHSAAMTNVDLCEDEKNNAILANVIGSQNLSIAANKYNSRIVYISSCGVYGDYQSNPYNELDATKPVNFHHFTKLEGEKRIKEHHSDFLIIRPGWLFGGTQNHRKNFVEARRKEALSNSVLKSAIDKSGSPSYTLDVAQQILSLIEAEQLGTYNIVNEGSASRYDYVRHILLYLKLNNNITPVNSNEFPRKANMPSNEVLDNLNLNLRGISKMRSWKDALEAYINKTYF